MARKQNQAIDKSFLTKEKESAISEAARARLPISVFQ
jgi:hypothetical protein